MNMFISDELSGTRRSTVSVGPRKNILHHHHHQHHHQKDHEDHPNPPKITKMTSSNKYSLPSSQKFFVFFLHLCC